MFSEPSAAVASSAPEPGAPSLNVAAFEPRSIVNGPGERAVVWVQGCPFRCGGCYNASFLPFVEAERLTVDALAEHILAVRGIEGVTFSGGEPFAQAQALCLLSRRLRRAGLTVLAYSGYTLAGLRRKRDPWIRALLDELDVLIDGPYMAARRANLPWRGSANQRVHFLTEAYRRFETAVSHPTASVELIVGERHLTATGTWDPAVMEQLDQALASEGAA